MQETWVRSLRPEDPLQKEMATHCPLFLPGKSHRQRSLAVYSPRGHKRVRLDWVTIQLQQNVFLQPMPILTTYQFFSRLWRTFLLFFLTSAFGFWVFLSACQGQCDGYGIKSVCHHLSSCGANFGGRHFCIKSSFVKKLMYYFDTVL